MDTRWMRCASCGAVIGVYEPIRAALPDGTAREGSLLTLRGIVDQGGVRLLHEECFLKEIAAP